jgi:hypothetical protein
MYKYELRNQRTRNLTLEQQIHEDNQGKVYKKVVN